MTAGLPEILYVFWGDRMEKQLVRQDERLDQEWVKLISEALKMGISATEIKLFLKQESSKTNR